ncbi:hypothetical protein E4191_04180 [Paracoccus liaowanqingii]|uniref:PepSY domain-containing protein n=1 Tax=Paracoccus liaowanqingii TaxID=2560053 RepID=A0A4P7HIS3_9RHOB|nr:hypothetical protein [Paracoccus liaowanqingii]QBX33994.1 hypothetical protein E4191_04180 [Paracoccus liaowanqingii]
MTLTHLASTAALIALVTGTAPVVAQTAPPAPATASTTGGVELPALLQGLDLGRVSVETKRDGQREYEGTLPDGTEIEAEFDMAGNLIKVEADDGILPAPVVDAALPAALRGHEALSLFATFEEIKTHPRHLEIKGHSEAGDEVEVKFAPDNSLIEIETDDMAMPQAMIDTILPQAVRSNEIISQFGMIEEIKAEYGRFEVKGEDAQGEDMRAQFDEAGNVLRFARDGERDGNREGRGPRHERGDHGRGDHDRGPRGDGPRGDMMRGDGPRGDARGQAPALEFDTVAVNASLTQAGYSAFGLLRQHGPRVMLDATNPQGEAVTLELDPEGEVLRETAR